MSTDMPALHCDLLTNIAKEEGLVDFDIDVNSGSIKGDNYLGIIKLVTLTDKVTSKKLYLVMKSAQTHAKLRTTAPIAYAYQRETFLYTTIFPEFSAFQKEFNIIKPFADYARVYGTCSDNCNECIILENLRESGYTLWNRKLPFNAEHVELVIRSYARWHATSLAYSKIYPENFKKLTKDLGETIFDEQILANNEGWIEARAAQFQSAIKVVEDNKVAIEALERLSKLVENFYAVDYKDEKYKIVITHGDCWCNNLMFKYYKETENPGKPTDVRVLDWQLAMTGSPVFDLAYFLCAGCVKEELDKIDHYLQVYHDTVSEHLRNFGCDADEVFPRSLLDEHWKKFAKHGLNIAMAVLKVVVGNSDEAPDLQQMAENGENFLTALNFQSKNDDLYKQRLTDVAVFMMEQNLV